jgi:haloalkane dehalogenase
MFEGTPKTLIIGAEITAWCAANIANLEIKNCGAACYLAPEDQPAAIAEAIVMWLDKYQTHKPISLSVINKS